MADAAPKRLAAEQRKAAILRAAITLLASKGVDGFSLEAVARQAGVALSLPRHYFGGYRDLLKAAAEDLLAQVETTLLSRELSLQLAPRFAQYLDILVRNPWAHGVWMRSSDIHPGIDSIVRKARRRMAEAMYRRQWRDLTGEEQLDARGRIGYIEAIVSDWLDRGSVNPETVIDLMVRTVRDPLDSKRTKASGPANP